MLATCRAAGTPAFRTTSKTRVIADFSQSAAQSKEQ